MKILVIVALVVFGQLDAHVLPLGVTVGITPYSHPITTLYHAQNNYGNYIYGYATPTSSKSETKTADGITHGGYSYIDANGILQTVQYVADPVHGFRVAATNLPKDSPDVALAKAKHLSEYATVQAEHAQIAAQRSAHITSPVALPQPIQDLPEVAKAKAEHLATLQAAYNTPSAIPQPVQDLPEVVKARNEHLAAVEATKARDAAINLSPIPTEISQPVLPIHTSITTHPVITAHSQISYTPAVWYDTTPTTQYHSQDSLGQYSYGYVGPLSSKAESKTADGVTRGGYSYIDANGILQTVNYISDPVNGFRVAATNLPVAPKTTLISPSAQTVVTKSATAPVIVENKEHINAVPLLYTQQFHY